MPRKIIPYQPYLKALARQLRNNSTFGEILLWNELKSGKMHGYDFQRQKPLLNYIADFYCNELNLVIEIDGLYHTYEEQYQLDISREDELKQYNLTILRFTETEVRRNMQSVLRSIEHHILLHNANPSREGS